MKTFTFSLLAILLAGTVAAVWFGHSRFGGLCDEYAHAMGPRAPAGTATPPAAPPPVFRGVAGGQEAILRISPWPPKAMAETSFTLELPGYRGTEPPRISLEMEGMDMGRNEVVPTLRPDGTWRGTGTFVACGSGRRDRVARVVIPGSGELPFSLELAR